jgi:hypothetical protein
MPERPRGGQRPADAIGGARIGSGGIEDDREELTSAAAQLGRRGGKARAQKLTPEQRAEIARKAARMRWQREA